MSEVKVNKISPRSGTDVTLGDSGDTFTIPSGATITNSGTANGFGATGAVNWNTTVKTGDFTAVSGEGYFVNSTSGEIDVTLPAGTAGSIIAVADYANTADTNNIILKQNGSDKIEGSTDDFIVNQEGASLTLVFVDSTKGWIITDTGNSTDASITPSYVAASGGNTTVNSPCGDYKIHTFTGPGTFTVSCVGNAAGSNTLEYLVVAGGGAGGRDQSGGGGAGGLRTNFPSPATGGLEVTATGYPVSVGGGGSRPGCNGTPGNSGSQSVFTGSSTITSAGGGGGTGNGGSTTGQTGGSGGGGDSNQSGSAGNTPPVTPPQGNPGGTSSGPNGAGGGGGASCAGGNSPGGTTAGNGGSGTGFPTVFVNNAGQPSGGNYYFSGGGGGSAHSGGTHGTGGLGGGGRGGGTTPPGVQAPEAGTDNQGGGGGGCGNNAYTNQTGGSGIVIIRYKFQN